MQDIGFHKIALNDQTYADLKLQNGDLLADEGLETAVLISLFSDRYVPKEELPQGFEDVKGWWADAVSERPGDRIGSRLWLLERGKITAETRNQMKDFAIEALAWLESDGVASKVEVSALLVQNTRIDLSIKVFKPEGENIPFRFVWDGQEMKRG